LLRSGNANRRELFQVLSSERGVTRYDGRRSPDDALGDLPYASQREGRERRRKTRTVRRPADLPATASVNDPRREFEGLNFDAASINTPLADGIMIGTTVPG
jgi:hypothetical protein